METPDGADAAPSVEYAKCLADPAYFLDSYGEIDDAQGHGDGGGTMRFRLWPCQVDALWKLMVAPLAIILKARQLGISWICCGYALWLCMFQPGKVVLVFSMGQLEADEMLRRVKVLYERLPEWLRDSSPLAKEPNTSLIEWANGSRVKSLPASRNSGSSFTASLVIMDEAAKIQFAGQLYTALKPTIDGGGQLIVLSTANGIGNLFHLLWTRAASGLNRFVAIFIPWWARPGRDQAWYDQKVAEESEPGKVKQEYPASATEAFLVSGRVRFRPEWVTAQEDNVGVTLADSQIPESLRIDGLAVYKLPEAGRRYIIAADVAEGLEHRDYSSAVVIDRETREEMADLHGHWEADEFAGKIAPLSGVYDAPAVVERNNHGHAVLLALRKLGVPVANGLDDRAGWLSGEKTKPVAIDALAVALRDGDIAIRTRATLGELLIYRVENDGRTSAPTGYHDDRVMKWAVGLGWLQVCGHVASLAGAGRSAVPDKRPRLESGAQDDGRNRRGETKRGLYGRDR